MDSIEEIEALVKKEESQQIVAVDDSNLTIATPTIKANIDTNKPFADQAKDLIGVFATKAAFQDKSLVQDVATAKAEELKLNAESNLKEEQVHSKEKDKKINEADYGIYEGVATYAGIKKPLPHGMQKVLFGILSIIQIICLIVIGIPVSIINIIADCINSIVEKLSSIAKSAKVLVLSLMTLLVIGGVIWIILGILNANGIIHI